VTPIDAALPFAVAAIALWAWLVRDSRWMTAVLAAIPALAVVEIAIAPERTRLLAVGIVTAAAFGSAVFAAELTPGRFVAFGLSATLLLRWIPLASVEWKKEAIVLAGVGWLLVSLSIRKPEGRAGGLAIEAGDRVRPVGTPLALAICLAIALVTPLHPGRMVFYPALVAAAQALMPWPVAGAAVLVVAAIIARYSLAALYILAAAALLVSLAARWSPLATRVILVFAAVGIALWPWSGAVSRLMPLPVAGLVIAAVVVLALSGRVATILGTLLIVVTPTLFFGESHAEDVPTVVGAALESSQSVDVDVPPGVQSVVMKISGANMERMRPGRVVGQIEAADLRGGTTIRVLRIGDVADFGFMRREIFFFSKNVPPRNASGDLRGYGNASFLWGAGRIPVRFAATPASLRVVAANDLPGGAKLQVETVEYRAASSSIGNPDSSSRN